MAKECLREVVKLSQSGAFWNSNSKKFLSPWWRKDCQEYRVDFGPIWCLFLIFTIVKEWLSEFVELSQPGAFWNGIYFCHSIDEKAWKKINTSTLLWDQKNLRGVKMFLEIIRGLKISGTKNKGYEIFLDFSRKSSTPIYSIMNVLPLILLLFWLTGWQEKIIIFLLLLLNWIGIVLRFKYFINCSMSWYIIIS